MSTNETPTMPLATTPEIDAERSTLRPQRPPPPLPTQFESSDLTTITSTEPETIFSPAEPVNEDIEDNRSSLLFQFNDLFDAFDYETVRHRILTRQMTTNPFTTVLWRIFLHCLPRNSCQWNQIIDGARDDYDDLVEKYLLDLQKIREHNGDARDLNHPLSQEENSLWNQYYVYEELKENIYQDVSRTCQEISFFRQKHILDLLLRVLYIHSRHHGQSLPYRQGMHEILAVIVYSIYSESLIINEYAESNEMMIKLYDPKYLAHDSYELYVKIMDHLQPFYDFKSNNMGSRKYANIKDSKHILFRRFNDVQIQANDTLTKVNSIFERLKEYDPALYGQLQDLNIEPMLFGIRWLRLLFGREIPFDSIPSLWTVIFCYDECFAFVDYFFLALLMEIGRIFKKLDLFEYSSCLQYLMQANSITDVEDVIQTALALERLAKTREAQRFTSSYSAQIPYTRSISAGSQKLISPLQYSLSNPMTDSTRSSFAAISLSQSGKTGSSKISNESEMNDNPGRETRQQFDHSIQIQKHCAGLMNKFIDGIRNHLGNLPEPNDEVSIQLNGLAQIANVLDGTLTLDDTSLQALVNYKNKENPIENADNDTA